MPALFRRPCPYRPLRALSVLVAALALLSAPAAAQGPAQVSVASSGAGADSTSVTTSRAAVSRWARSVVFASDATNLASNVLPRDTNGVRDVFVRDLVTGSTVMVSLSVSNGQGDGPSGGFFGPNGNPGCTISRNGRHVAFTSIATNLVPGVTASVLRVYVRDRDSNRNGVLDETSGVNTVLVGELPDGSRPDGRCYQPSLSADGRFVAFTSEATNLTIASGDSNGASDVFVQDRDFDANRDNSLAANPIFDELRLGDGVWIRGVSVSSGGVLGNGASSNPSISGDGRLVAFESAATNLVAGDSNGRSDIFVHELGQFLLRNGATTRVSVSASGGQADADSFNPSISWNGRYVAFDSLATNLAPSGGDSNGVSDVFVRDRQMGTTVRVSVTSGGAQANGLSDRPSISDDGRFVAFLSLATDLAPGTTNSVPRIYVHDRDADSDRIFDEPGAIATTLVGQVMGPGPVTERPFPSMDPAGTAVLFPSDNALAPADSNGTWDVYLQTTPLAADSDGDGLLDVWETSGIDSNGDSNTDAVLWSAAGNANPNHKDLFVEVDWMTEDLNGNGVLDAGSGVFDGPEDLNGNGVIDQRPFLAQAQTALVNAFAAVPNAALGNPDGRPGITLHLIVNDRVPMPGPQFGYPAGPWAANPWPQFAYWKSLFFGTSQERSSPNFQNIRAARLMAYRYCIFGDRIGSTTISGMAELVGNDFMVTLGAWPVAGGTWQQQAGVFMHELGHNLGLQHGGLDNVNYKPNYHSVMNWTWTVPAWVPGLTMSGPYFMSWRLDYSLAAWPALDESNLNEVAGIAGHAGDSVPYGPLPAALGPETGPIDWNRDGSVSGTGIAADINTVAPRTVDPNAIPVPGQVLLGSADWPSLSYPLAGNGNFANAVSGHLTPAGGELSYEVIEALAGLYSSPGPRDCCGAGLNLAFSAKAVRSARPFEGAAGDTGELCSANGGTLAAAAPEGGTVPVYADIVAAPGPGVQGWSLAVEVTGDLGLERATTAGTAAAPAKDGGLLDGGFSHAEVIDPAENWGRRGAVSAVVLSFSEPIVLPAGTASVLRLDLSSLGGGGDPAVGAIAFTDGLVGSGQPVSNMLTADSETEVPCNALDASVRVVIETVRSLFRRGDPNGDGGVDISDGVKILNHLFLGAPAPECLAAADVNGDGGVDISDASYLFNHLFLGGPPLPQPYPGCGADPEGEPCMQDACAER
ncbi:MAG: PD40 domain-containing protein [Planctomycetes bacterium]|nr:PD40 domain-containing protein [Planctomycetota bacterium]